MLVASNEVLESIEERSRCPNCLSSRKYFCYTCHIPMPVVKDCVPYIELPLKVDIIKHHLELSSKSTAVHAAILAPSSTAVYIFPEMPTYSSADTIVLFPDNDALSVNDVCQRFKCTVEKNASFSSETTKFLMKKIVVIDGTWFQVKQIRRDERLKGLCSVRLDDHETQFWRPNGLKCGRGLATIEAIYYFFKEYNAQVRKHHCSYNADERQKNTDDYLDNLLFFYSYFHKKILGKPMVL